MLTFVGYIFIFLGLASALPLLLNPFGLMATAAPWAAWVAYPAFIVGGLVIAGLGSEPKAIGLMFKFLGAILLAAGCAAALALVGAMLGVVELTGGIASLIYLLVTGLVFGVLGLVATMPAGKRAGE